MTAEALEDPDSFIRTARTCWLVDRHWDVLHAVPDEAWTAAARADMAREFAVFSSVRLACGLLRRRLCIPGPFSRGHEGGLPRCEGCCEATGLPQGLGSPLNDTKCREILGLD